MDMCGMLLEEENQRVYIQLQEAGTVHERYGYGKVRKEGVGGSGYRRMSQHTNSKPEITQGQKPREAAVRERIQSVLRRYWTPRPDPVCVSDRDAGGDGIRDGSILEA